MNDFQNFAYENKKFKYVPVLTKPINQNWAWESGHIDGDMLRRYIKDLTNPTYFLSGSANMVGAMRQMLLANGVKKRAIRTDEFIGY